MRPVSRTRRAGSLAGDRPYFHATDPPYVCDERTFLVTAKPEDPGALFELERCYTSSANSR
jgi:hypothetical protein